MTMRAQALALAARGFKLFPIKAGQKTPPLIAQWQVHATSDPAQIEAWWTQWPEANIGIHCDGLVVIDVDPKKGGFDSLALLEQELDLDETYEVSTPSGGRHIYYRATTPVRNGVDVLGRGIDVRTTNGYVVAAGSHTERGSYQVVCDAPVADVHSGITLRIAARQASAGNGDARDAEAGDRVATDSDAAVARAISHLRTHAPAISGHGGDHHTFRTICRVRDFGVPQERAAEALSDWNSTCQPPWDAGELAIKIENAYRYAQDAAGKLTPEALGFGAVAESQAEVDETGSEQTEPAPATNLLHPSEVALDDVLHVEYLIKGVMEKQSNALIFGTWNVGKTFVVLDMAASIATGAEWFGKRVTQGRVLYIGYEGIRAMKKRIIALRAKYPKLTDPSTPFAWAPMIHPLTRSEGVKEIGGILRAFMARFGSADLVIIDPLQNALGGDDADANLMAELNLTVADIMRKQRCTVLRVHHSGHSNEERARGHSSLPAGIDTQILVESGEIRMTKQRDDVKGRFNFTLDVVKVGVDQDGEDVKTCVVKHIEDNPMSPDLTPPQRELLDAVLRKKGNGEHITKTELNDAAKGMTPTKKREALAALEIKQYLRASDNGYIVCERGPMAIFD